MGRDYPTWLRELWSVALAAAIMCDVYASCMRALADGAEYAAWKLRRNHDDARASGGFDA